MLPGVGFFGCGSLAQLLLQQLQEHGFRVVGLWAPNETEAAALATQRGIPFHSSVVDQVLLQPAVQLVVTACPPHFHHQIASKACGIGKHVLCDWPAAHTIRDAARMSQAAANYPALIALLLTALRFVPSFHIMRKLICQDRFLGQVRLLNATVLCDVLSVSSERCFVWDGHMGGGLLSLYGTNVIDIIGYLTGCRARRVHGLVQTVRPSALGPNATLLNRATEDFVNFQMELYPVVPTANKQQPEEAVMATVTLNGHHYNSQVRHEIYVYGSSGYLVCRDGDIYAYRESAAGGPGENGTAILSAPLRENLIYSINKNEWCGAGTAVYPKLYMLGIRNLVQAVKNAFGAGSGPDVQWNKEQVAQAVNFDEAVHLQAVIEAVRLSSELREWVRVHA